MTEINGFGEFIAERDVDYYDGPYYEDEAYDSWRAQYDEFLDAQYEAWCAYNEYADDEEDGYRDEE